ncbi:ESPR-type extended signal peptide-containing protein [Stenotrophomonas indicatrix]|uniref:ESPR-type extended signal peptide-containing protein n=1 Tax=Stenotrophomonas indicatrix TaxID=2045451 RepID=UPI00289D8C8B|nr:ESPR-type extended signal peptide-containing protein [Stenotrophomonas indicatrix]
MNKIYRRLWSTARQCWIVASELASPRGKRASTVLAAGTVGLVMLATVAQAAEREVEPGEFDEQSLVEDYPATPYVADPALRGLLSSFPLQSAAAAGSINSLHTQVALTTDNFYRDSTVSGDLQMILGSRSSLTGSKSVGYGSLLTASGTNNVAVGYGVRVRQGYSTAVGAESYTDGVGATAFGNNAKAYADNSIAVGSGSRTNDGAGISRIAIGGDAYAGSSGWTGAIALGGDSRAEYDGVVIGYGAKSSATGAVALGSWSVANETNTVSVGSSGTKRRIVNVNDARLSSTSSDAVTGKQLYATNSNVTKAQTAADGAKTTATAAQSTANTANSNANSALAKANAVSGLVSQVSAAGNVRLGGENTGTVLDVRNKSNAVRSITGLKDGALSTSSTEAVTGKQLNATNTNVTSAKTAADAAKTTAAAAQSTATTANTNANTALAKANTVSGLVSQVSATGNVRLGGENTGTVLDARNKSNAVRSITGLKDGALSASSTEAVTGKQLNATNANVTTAQTVADAAKTTATAAQTTATTANTNANTALAKANTVSGLVSQVSASGNVRLGGENTGTVLDARNKSNAVRSITGLKDGALSTSSTEAVTGKQLNATNSNVAAVKSTADAAQARVAVLNGLVGQVSASGNVRLGADNTGTVVDVANKSGAKRKLQNLANGVLSTSSTDAVTGQQLNATNSEVTSVRTAATAAKTAADAARSVADGAVQKADALGGLVGQVSASGNVRLGAENTGTIVDVANKSGGKRRIYNIANGTLSAGSTDAVTGQQLFATNATVETQRQALAGHAQQLTDQDGRIADNRVELDALRTDFDNFSPDLEGVVKFSTDRLLVDMEGARVSGLAAGDISSATSTDAVNGGQLFVTNARLEELAEAGELVSVGSGGPGVEAVTGLVAVAVGDSTRAEGEGAVALGSFAVAEGKNSVALGRAASVAAKAEDGFALGVRASVESAKGVAIGAGSSVAEGAFNSVAIGAGSVANDVLTVSFGEGALKRRLVNVARGMSESDASTIGQLSDALAALGGGAGIGPGGDIVAPVYGVQGGVQNNVGDALATLDGAVVRSDSRVDGLEGQLRATFQQSPSTRVDGVGQLNLAGAQGMVLSNLADGRIAAGSRDAVTGSQLYAAKQEIDRNKINIDQLMGGGRGIANEWFQGPIDFAGAQITGVAAADISSAASTDAVNGGQLFATNSRINDVERKGRYLAVGDTGVGQGAFSGAFGLAVGDGAEASLTSEGATAVGAFATAKARNSVALGRASYVHERAEDGFAVGGRSQVAARGGIALGAESEVRSTARNSVAIGYQSIANDADTVSLGNDLLKRRIANVANGRNTNDAATIGQLRGALSTLGGNIDANGNVTTPGFTVQGQHQSTVNDALTTLDAAVVTTGSRVDRVETQLRSVFQETPSTRSDGTAQLTLVGANGMVISNVANGLVAAGSREAVNGGQLHAVQQQLNGRMDGLEQRVDGQPQSRAVATASAAPTEQVTPTPEASDSPQVASAGEGTSPTPQPKSKQDDTPSPTPQVDTAELEKMLARANEYTDGAISNFERRLDKMDKRFNRMAAMSSAQTAMAMNTAGLATYNRLGAGVGYAEGESAMAVGYQRVLNDKGSATFSLNGAFTNSGERSMGVGVGIGW